LGATYTAHGTSTQSGKYIVPFFWASEQVPGETASALAMFWSSDKTAYQAWQAADEELKGTSILTRFIGSMKFTSAELQGVVIPVDFAL
jgi:hypothetical protein